jgi:polysaccharide biosynthesis protein PslE
MFVNESSDFLTFSRVLEAIRKRWFGIGFVTLLAIVLSTAICITLPNVFQSESMLYIKIGRGTVAIDPATSASGSHISLMDSRQSEINSVREMLLSRVVVERAIKVVGVERVMQKQPWYEAAKKNASTWAEDQADWLKATFTGRPLDEIQSQSQFDDLPADEVAQREALEEAVERVYNHVFVQSAKDSYTLLLVCRAYSPTLARDICQAIVDEYRKVHVEAHSVRGSLEFFEEQYNESQTRLANLEAELRDTKNRTQMMTITGKQDLVLQEIKQLQSDYIKVNADIAAARAKDVELVAKIDALPERMDTQQTEGVANQATDAMRNQLFELEMLEKDLTNRYTPTHPLVTQVREKMVAARKIFDSQETDRTLVNSAINPVRQELELDRFRNLSTLEGLKAQQDELTAKIANANSKAEKVNADEVLLNDLERQIQLVRTDVMNYGHKQEEARLLDQLDSANLSDVSVPQPPTLVLEKVGPRRSLLVAGCALCALLASCCLAIFRESTIAKTVDRTPSLEEQFSRMQEQFNQRSSSVKSEIKSSVSVGTGLASEKTEVAERIERAIAKSTKQSASPWSDS